MFKKTIAEVEVRGRRVLMRVDLNVPMEDGQLLDDQRLRLALDSIRNVLDRGGRLVLLSHLGRPQGEGYEADLSLAPCARHLSELLCKPVLLASDCVGPRVRGQVQSLQNGQVLLLENLRFHEPEVLNDLVFAAELADLGDVYCNEAFATAHRSHASLVALPGLMTPRPCVSGLQLYREVRYLRAVLAEARRPFVLLLGGTRVSDKVGALVHLQAGLDTILVGGAMACALLAAEGHKIGELSVNATELATARQVLDLAGHHRSRLLLPEDHVARRFHKGGDPSQVFDGPVSEGWTVCDVGPRTLVRYCDILRHAGTIIWSGPMGEWETKPYDVGTKLAALAVAHATLVNRAQTVIAGSSTAMAVERFGLQQSVSHISSGGAATMAMLEGRSLPGIDLLDDQNEGEQRGVMSLAAH